MKKLTVFLLTLILSLSVIPFTACNQEEPVYDTEFTYDDNYHWRAQTNGDGYTEHEAHVNKQGKCNKCGYYFECDELVYYPIYEEGEIIGLNCVGAGGPEEYDFDEIYTTMKDAAKEVNFSSKWKHIKIPAEAEYQGQTYPVLTVGHYAFVEELVQSVILPDGLKEIGYQTFGYTTLLEELVIPDSVTAINNSMFYYASGIKRVIYGNGLKKINRYTFYSCGNLEYVKLGNSIEYIDKSAFAFCNKLKYLVVPASVTGMMGDAPADMPTNHPDYTDYGSVFGHCEPTTRLYLEHDAVPEGYASGWNPVPLPVLLKGEWRYNENGEPEPII